jgi:methylase of polypeptide subunit release factors
VEIKVIVENHCIVGEQQGVPAESFFVCPGESDFYSTCLRFMVFDSPTPQTIHELGAGDGLPVLKALSSSSFSGTITGYEINGSSAAQAKNNILLANDDRYRIVNACFFESFARSDAGACIVANPPYIPADTPEKLILPALWGGIDGSSVLQRLLDLDASYLLLLIPSIANPLRVIRYALAQGYFVHKYLITTLPFAYYTSQDYVQQQLNIMRREGVAFFLERHYLAAGVLFSKKPSDESGLADSLQKLLTFS